LRLRSLLFSLPELETPTPTSGRTRPPTACPQAPDNTHSAPGFQTTDRTGVAQRATLRWLSLNSANSTTIDHTASHRRSVAPAENDNAYAQSRSRKAALTTPQETTSTSARAHTHTQYGAAHDAALCEALPHKENDYQLIEQLSKTIATVGGDTMTTNAVTTTTHSSRT
jgi:hypothetical protein